MLLCLIERVGDRGLHIFGPPLLCPRWTLCQLPFVFEQVLEKEIAPLRRCLRPSDFRTASDGVGADAGAVLALPADALILKGAAFPAPVRPAKDRRHRAS